MIIQDIYERADMEFLKATIQDLDQLYEMYNAIIDHQKLDRFHAHWTKDVYPSKNILYEHLKNDAVYVAKEGDRLAGAGIISLKEDPIYHGGPWSVKLKDEEIAVLHLFAIHPKFRKRGLASDLLKHIISETSKTSKAIHMDVLKGNEAAFALYQKAGFVNRGEYTVRYEDTGEIIVDLMEYNY